jgi:hypothetical protein
VPAALIPGAGAQPHPRTFALRHPSFGPTHMPMEIHEQALRQILASPHGRACGQAILDGVAEGIPLVIDAADGGVVNCTQVFEALSLLRQFGWSPKER